MDGFGINTDLLQPESKPADTRCIWQYCTVADCTGDMKIGSLHVILQHATAGQAGDMLQLVIMQRARACCLLDSWRLM